MNLLADQQSTERVSTWLSKDPSGEQGGFNLFGYAGNDPINSFDPDGLKFVFMGSQKKQIQSVVECWLKKLSPTSPLGKIVNDLNSSDRDIRITQLSDIQNYKPDTTNRPYTTPDSFDIPPGHDTTTYINVQSYSFDGRTWTFPQALAHELLHAHDDQSIHTLGRDLNHSDPNWLKEEKELTKEADTCGCK